MAALAIAAELAPMYVRMAIGTMRAYIFEYQAGMAAHAGNFRMHAAQRITRLIMIELRIRADRFPVRIRVAILAGNGDCPVRVRNLGLRSADLRIRITRRLL